MNGGVYHTRNAEDLTQQKCILAIIRYPKEVNRNQL